MSANCCAQHYLLSAACLETTIHTRALSEQRAQDQLYCTFHLILKEKLFFPLTEYLQLISALSICQELNTNCIGRSLWEKGQRFGNHLQAGNCLSLFNYIVCEGPSPKAPSKWWMWIWCVDPELFEMWAVFQWSMYKVHEQKHFQWVKQLLLYIRIYELLFSFC